MRFFSELKRRNVVRTGAAYAVVVWIILQVAAVTFPPLGVPDWVMTGLIVLAVIGLPVTVIVSWFYELTPGGVMTAKEADAAGYQPSTAFGRQIDFVIIGLLVVAVGWLIWRQEAGPGPPEYSVAVLPFANASNDPDEDYFSDGISEQLMFALAQIEQLKVAGRTSSFFYKGKNADLKVIGESLGVSNVLEGSVRRSGDQLRITAQLIRVEDGFSVWSETFERPALDVFAVQDEISRAIVDALQIRLIGGAGSGPTVRVAANLDAYNLYLLGRHHFELRTEAELEQARTYFEQAIERDPNYTPAYSGLADTLLFLARGAYGSLPHSFVIPEALSLIQTALALDPLLPEIHASLGFLRFYERDVLAAEAALERAIELSPNMARAHNWLYLTYSRARRYREAFEALERALRIDPLSAIVNTNMAAELWERSRFDEGLTAAGRAIQIAPQNPLGYRLAGRIHRTRGDLSGAMGWYLQAEAIAPGEPITELERGTLLIDLGEIEEAAVRLGDRRYEAELVRGRIAEALAITRQNLALRPDHLLTIFAAARVEIWAGNYAAAGQMLEPLAEDSEKGKGSLFTRSGIHFWDPAIGAFYLVMARDRSGDARGADELLGQIDNYYQHLRAEGLDQPGILYQQARVRALGGQTGEALALLRQSVDGGWRFWYMGQDPMLENLWGDAAFTALIDEIAALAGDERAKFLAGSGTTVAFETGEKRANAEEG